jgi:anti-sigma regulatory factor (Ser/Thr protein kinase)
MKRTVSFPGQPASVSAARRFVTEALTDTPSEALDAVELMVSELATNCIRHADAAFELTVVQQHGTIRVEVTDPAGGTPTMRSPGPDDPHGRGLRIVNMLSGAWGVRPRTAGGKTVWFTVAAPPPGSARTARDGVAH